MTWTSNQIDGPIFIPVLDGEGQPTEAVVPGYHVNTTPEFLTQHPEVAAHVVTPTPNTLRQVWAGDDCANPVLTVPLTFADEAEAKAVLGWAAD
jgi:hypothetical protein